MLFHYTIIYLTVGGSQLLLGVKELDLIRVDHILVNVVTLTIFLDNVNGNFLGAVFDAAPSFFECLYGRPLKVVLRFVILELIVEFESHLVLFIVNLEVPVVAMGVVSVSVGVWMLVVVEVWMLVEVCMSVDDGLDVGLAGVFHLLYLLLDELLAEESLGARVLVSLHK